MNGVVMTTFTIEPENNITAFASVKEARASHIEQAEYFSSQADLGKLAVSWPAEICCPRYHTCSMPDDPFDALGAALRSHGPDACFELLIQRFREEKKYPLLFEA